MVNGQRVVYARVSTTGQDLRPQRERLADCDKLFEEKVSGAKGTSRRALEEAMNYVREGYVYVVTKLDRLPRSVLELMQITQNLQCKKDGIELEHEQVNPPYTIPWNIFGTITQTKKVGTLKTYAL